jgi:hypothetical protein
MQNRVFFQGTELVDASATLSKSNDAAFEFSYGEDNWFYIGSRLPFNNFFIKVVEANDVETEIKIENWTNRQWRPVVDIIDGTDSLAKSGVIEFTPDREYSWERTNTNYLSDKIPELKDVVVYDKYWLRFGFNDALTPDMSVSFIGNLFSNDEDLKVEYPDLMRANVLEAFEKDKEDWEKQHIKAADIVIKDLIDMGVIQDKGQVLNWRDYTDAAIHKVAEIVFNSFGDDYTDNSVAARREYQDRISKRIHRVDRDRDAIESPAESFNVTGFMTR